MNEIQSKQFKPAATAARSLAGFDTAILSLSRAAKALSFYPPEHPRRREEITSAINNLRPLVASQELILLFSREGCSSNCDKELRSVTPAAQYLARDLLSRKIKQLTILSDITTQELLSFLMLLTMSPEEIAADGGMEIRMQQMGIRSIWVNEVDLSTIRKKLQQSEAPGQHSSETEQFGSLASFSIPEFPENEDQKIPLAELLKMLSAEKRDQLFINLAKTVVSRAEKLKAAGDYSGILPPLVALMDAADDTSRTAAQRDFAIFSLEQIAATTATPFLIQLIEQRIFGKEEIVYRLCGQIGETLSHPLVKQLCSSENLGIRKALAYAIIRAGKAAVPALTEMLKDNRWYVVRNMVSILGEIADTGALPKLIQIANHPELKVRKELIKALSRIGSAESERLLIDLLNDPEPDIVKQSIHSLGILHCRGAVPGLLNILEQPDRFLKNLICKKEAATALGRIGDKKATPYLLKILGSRKWLATQKWQELKICIATAIGNLGDDSALPLLTRLASRNNELGQACSDALDNLERLGK